MPCPGAAAARGDRVVLTQRAELLLADEPVASLDPENGRLILELLRLPCATKG